ncbi:MAG: transcription-repair coupling factor, partial [Bacteroidales bacterium]|nr:transcription-repair coupling factor [Bacteroidales bacterium]
ERLALYRELDNIADETHLTTFINNLTDRFGALPRQAEDLINTVRLRRLAKTLGMEKIILKQNKMLVWFVSKPDTTFYQSAQFSSILLFIQKNPRICRMKENNGRLSLTIDYISDVTTGLEVLERV